MISKREFDFYPLSELRSPYPKTTTSDTSGTKEAKRQKPNNTTPIVFATLEPVPSTGSDRPNGIKPLQVPTYPLKVLLDSGATGCMVDKRFCTQFPVTKDETTVWRTAAGNLTTVGSSQLHFKLTELDYNATIKWSFHVSDMSKVRYDMIIGGDLLRELGIDLKYSTNQIAWGQAVIPMRDRDATSEEMFSLADSMESEATRDATARLNQILEAKYEKARPRDIVAACEHLNKDEQAKLERLLKRFEHLFDGTLGMWNGDPYRIELRAGVTPYHAKAYPVPKAYERTLRLEIERLVRAGVLRKVNRSEWAFPTFIIPKKDGTVRVITDFRELNKRIKRLPYPLPIIQDLLLKLEGFTYGTSLDLNMGYYHIELDLFSRKLCTFVLPWGKYEYTRLPMGLCNSPDIFQEKMSELMAGLEFVKVYLDDLLTLTKGDFEDHLSCLEKVLDRISMAGLKVNAKKSFFARGELEYLGYWITREGISPVLSKIDAMKKIKEPTNKKELRSFIGMINFYRDMWQRRSDLLAPLSALTSKTSPWKWTEVEQKAFEAIKQMISKETLLTFPKFNEPFHVHADASKYQLGAVISQNNKPIGFYSRKLNSAQINYTTGERELLSIVETLKAYRNILLGQTVIVHTDHKNLVYKNSSGERIMRWRLILEEFGPTWEYIPGEKNLVADALSRLETDNNQPPKEPTTASQSLQAVAEALALEKEDLPRNAYPLKFSTIQKYQQTDTNLAQLADDNSDYYLMAFRGGGKNIELICYKGKIVIPVPLQTRIAQWYHVYLAHPGETRTEQTIRQHLYWPKLRETVHKVCRTCTVCQKEKKTHKKYGHLPEKEAEAVPWEKLCVDLIGPYSMKRKDKKELTLWCLTMIDPATGWFEMKEIPTKRADYIANLVEQTWLTRYPWPSQLVFDRGSEFMAEFTKMVKEDYGVKTKPITARNPQANSIIERIHQTIGNIIRTFDIDEVDDDDPWSGILAATMFAVRATYHTTTQATPMQLVFQRDAILNIPFHANWEHIKRRKQDRIHKNNEKENKKRTPHTYRRGHKVLYKKEVGAKFDPIWDGPYPIRELYDNGTIKINTGVVDKIVNIRNVRPYFEE